MAISKKASVKAIEYCQKLTETKLGKSATWEQLFEIIMDGFDISIESHCAKFGDCTIVQLYRYQQDELIERWSFPNTEVFDDKTGEFIMPVICKAVVEYLVKNLKKLNKGQKPKAKVAKVETKVDVTTLMKEVTALKNAIKEATGAEKKKLIKEYNDKSILLQTELEKNAKEEDAKRESAKASEDELKTIRKKKAALMQRIKEWDAKGKDTSELKEQLRVVSDKLTAARTGLTKR